MVGLLEEVELVSRVSLGCHHVRRDCHACRAASQLGSGMNKH